MELDLKDIVDLIKASGFEGEITSIVNVTIENGEIVGIFTSGEISLGFKFSALKSQVFKLSEP